MRSASFLSGAPVTIQFVRQTRWQINNQQNAVFLSKQWCAPILFYACSGNSQDYWPEVLEMTWELLPEAAATVPRSSPAQRDNSFDCSLNRHEITVLNCIILQWLEINLPYVLSCYITIIIMIFSRCFNLLYLK
jgi:hypothetical protein